MTRSSDLEHPKGINDDGNKVSSLQATTEAGRNMYFLNPLRTGSDFEQGRDRLQSAVSRRTSMVPSLPWHDPNDQKGFQ